MIKLKDLLTEEVDVRNYKEFEKALVGKSVGIKAGSGITNKFSADARFLEKNIKGMFKHYFYDWEFLHNFLSNGKEEYVKLMDDFIEKEVMRNFKKYFKYFEIVTDTKSNQYDYLIRILPNVDEDKLPILFFSEYRSKIPTEIIDSYTHYIENVK